jgi:pimeloyl-ACP methyl ester carboxylesterase
MRTPLGEDRRYYVTAETVADIEALRSALGATRLTLDGVSYGTYAAERPGAPVGVRGRALRVGSSR